MHTLHLCTKYLTSYSHLCTTAYSHALPTDIACPPSGCLFLALPGRAVVDGVLRCLTGETDVPVSAARVGASSLVPITAYGLWAWVDTAWQGLVDRGRATGNLGLSSAATVESQTSVSRWCQGILGFTVASWWKTLS